MLIEYLYRKSIGARSSQELSIEPLLFLAALLAASSCAALSSVAAIHRD